MSITVLRLNHRAGRDKRVTTHLFLAARAFGADKAVLSGDNDSRILNSVNKTSKNWGGSFNMVYERNWKNYIKNFPGKKVHLTMYGLPVQRVVKKIRSNDLLVIVGGSKVPGEVYELADFNVAITSQPHSEISSLSVFLDKLFDGKELSKKFAGGKKIVPQKKGKLLFEK